MNLDWLINFLPVLNATGIPLLAIGIILLLRAYQKSVEAYKDTTFHLKDENERLRKRLNETESRYFGDFDKMRESVSQSIQIIEELQTKKTYLLQKGEMDSNSTSLSDSKNLNQAIQLLKDLSTAFKIFDLRLQGHIINSQKEFHDLSNQLGKSLGVVANQVSDVPTKLIILKAVKSIEEIEIGSPDSNIIQEIKKLDTGYSLDKQLEMLKVMLDAETIEAFQVEALQKSLLRSIASSIEELNGKSENKDSPALVAKQSDALEK